MFRGYRASLTSLQSIFPAYWLSETFGTACIRQGLLFMNDDRGLGVRLEVQPRSFSCSEVDRASRHHLNTSQKRYRGHHLLSGLVGAFHLHTSPQEASRGTISPKFHQVQDKVDAKAQVVFDTCWRRLENKLQGKLQVPKEIVWLNGAPGSGKGVNTPFILESRGLSRAVTMSSLFDDRTEIRETMDRGELVPDTMVGDAVLDTIFEPDADCAGLVIDGFPRTALQVEFLKLLYDKMLSLHVQYADSPDEWRYPRPSFKIVVLYVEADESIKRQLLRAQQASLHNRRVMDAGTGSLQDIRPTDADVVKCRRRYEVFKAHYGTLLMLKQYFPFSLIDAMGSLEECREQIAREMRYQSSMDLEEATYSAIRHLPLARELVRTSRQQLVSHLDRYCKKHNALFHQVINVIDSEAMPVLKRCSLAGHAELKTHNTLFSEFPLAAEMLMDILTDRGFATAYFVDEQVIPVRVDLATGDISSRFEHVHHFRITFESAKVRTAAIAAAKGSQLTLSSGVPGRSGAAIGWSSVPSHLDNQAPRPSLKESFPCSDQAQPDLPIDDPGLSGKEERLAASLQDGPKLT